MQHRVLVVGATGKSGREAVKYAVAAGHSVTAFVRDPANATFDPVVKIAVGDVLNTGDVDAAVADNDVVISALGSKGLRRAAVCAPGVSNIVSAMNARGARRLIAVSAYGTGESNHGIYGWLLNTLLGSSQRDKVEMEKVLAKSGLDWTSVRPPGLTQGPATGKYRAAPEGEALRGFQRISRADVADFMVKEIDSEAWVGRSPTVTSA
ncbi:MAG: NAD(P)-dependent oxidoreductase [Alphaproteobacteria bacterium]